MTIIWATGFEHGNLEMIPSFDRGSSNTTSITPYSKHTGNFSLQLTNLQVDGYIYIRLNVSGELYLNFWAHPEGTTTSGIVKVGIVSYTTGWTVQFGLKFENGYWNAYRNDVKVGTSGIQVQNVWHMVSLHLKSDGTSDVIQTKIDGVADIDYSGAGSSKSLDYFAFHSHASGGGQAFSFDDIVFGDSSGWLGDLRIEALKPTQDTSDKGWTASTGSSNYAMVDEVPADDADYVWTETNDALDLYEIENWDGTDKTPVSIVQWMRAWKLAAADQKIKMVVQSGATVSESADVAITASAALYSRILNQDPNGNIAWTDAAIDALKIGQKAVI